MGKLKTATRNIYKSVRNFTYLIIMQLSHRLACALFGHVGVKLNERVHTLRIFSPWKRRIMGVNACEKCGKVFLEDLPASDEQAATRVRLRDLF
jgi:hypothetical protein